MIEDIPVSIGKFLQPTLGTSTLKTFRVPVAVIMLFCWLLALPIELILHRRIGKRYMNTVFYLLASILTNVVVATLVITALPANSVPVYKGWAPNQGWKAPSPEALIAATPAWPLFACVMNLAFWAFVCQYIANRRRFATPDQGHSLDFGIPWIVYPPRLIVRALLSVCANGRAPGTATFVAVRPLNRRRAAPTSEIGAAWEWVKNEAANSFMHIQRCFAAHIDMLRQGKHPHGPVACWAALLIEPLLLAVAGVYVISLNIGCTSFGIYLLLVGFAMFVKGRIYIAEWRERVYNEKDQELEAQAMRNIRQHKPVTQLSEAFTVPITSAVLPPSSPVAPEPVVAGPGFEALLTPMQPVIAKQRPDQGDELGSERAA